MARKKPCDCCEADYLYQDEEKQNQLYVEFYPDNNGLFSAGMFGKDDIGETVELSWSTNFEYCPYCGRKLV